jgi:hypothetical protein
MEFFLRVTGEVGANAVANAFRIFAMVAIVAADP